jgi:ABC-2 type transport system permease protein
MAPVRRYAQLLGAAAYAVLFGLVHTLFVLAVLWLFFDLDLSRANFATALAFTLLGTVSFAGIGIAASVLPLMYVERGAQMVFVIQSLLLASCCTTCGRCCSPGWCSSPPACGPSGWRSATPSAPAS